MTKYNPALSSEWDNQSGRYGVVLVFNDGLTRQQVCEILTKISEHVDPKYSSSHVYSFNPEYGSPVWYIP